MQFPPIMSILVVSLLSGVSPLGALDPDFLDARGFWRLDRSRVLASLQPEVPAPAKPVEEPVQAPSGPAEAEPRIPKDSPYPSILQNNLVVSYYGSPRSTKMGILGEQSLEETGRKLKVTAKEWDAVNGEQGVIPALHLIYATVWSDANVGILSDEVIRKYVEYAAANGMIVVLDHQIGKNDVEKCMRQMLPWLKYPNVHLALDPEWMTETPGKVIGSMHARDLNKAQQIMQDYLVSIGAKERRMLIVHQFHFRQILERETVRDDFDMIDLIHNADGFGSVSLKMDTYRFVAKARNMPVKGFKLFYPKSWKSKGFDSPLMTPAQVLAIKPRPVFINYQ